MFFLSLARGAKENQPSLQVNHKYAKKYLFKASVNYMVVVFGCVFWGAFLLPKFAVAKVCSYC